MSDKLKIGLISFAHGHANSYFRCLERMPDVEITAIADERRSRVEHVLARCSAVYYEDYKELLQTDIDAVIICSENVRHAEHTLAAAYAGKHVLCEKPLGVTMEEMQAMIDVCDKQGVQLMTSFPCRYLPAVAAAKEAIGRGEIGEIVAVKGMNRGTMPGQWFIDPALSGGGAVLDHTVHVMDLLNWLLNSPVTEVCAEAGTLFHDIPVEDAGMVHVKFASGASAVIDTSWSRSKSFHSGGDVMLTIVGTEGVISVDALAQKNEVYSDDAPHSRWSCWGDSMDAYLVKAFVDALRQRREVPITGEDGLRSAQVALAAYASIRSGRTVKFIEGRFAG